MKNTGVKEKITSDEECYAVLPAYESFIQIDKQGKLVKPGDCIIGSIITKSVSGLLLKVICVDGEFARNVADLGIKAFCPMSNIIPAADKKNVSRTYMMNDTVCCEVIEIIPDTDKLVCGMKGTLLPPGSDQGARLGLIHSDDFPPAYKYVPSHLHFTYTFSVCTMHVYVLVVDKHILYQATTAAVIHISSVFTISWDTQNS
ncbi:unnamed protein product, partial [Timema podura]|nr:unnamed protein product [Timema podura]